MFIRFWVLVAAVFLLASCTSEPVTVRGDLPVRLTIGAEPDVNQYFALEPGAGETAIVARLFQLERGGGDSSNEARNIFHVASVNTGRGPARIYRWTETTGWGPTRENFNCVGGPLVYNNCTNSDYPVQFGNFGNGGMDDWRTSIIDQVPPGSAAVVIEFESGKRYGSDVVDGLAFIAYDAEDGEVVSVEALDPDGNIVEPSS